MTVSNANYLRSFHDATKALGAKIINADFTLEIEGFEGNYLLCKQAPWPELSPAGEIEVPTPLGAAVWQPQQLQVHQQGAITMMETMAGSIDKMMIELITRGGNYANGATTFNAKIYEGTPQKHLRYKRIVDAFIQMENPDRDWENRSQILLFSGTIFYHYYGETEAGNSSDYR